MQCEPETDDLFDEAQRQSRKSRERRRAAWIERFTVCQIDRRDWISFREIATWYSERGGSAVPDEPQRLVAYDMLAHDLLDREFQERGTSQVLFLHPAVKFTRMTPEKLFDLMVTFSGDDICSAYLDHCWIPARLFRGWLAKHELPHAPPRFQARKVSTPLAPTTRGEPAAIKMLSAHLRDEPNMTRAKAKELCAPFGISGNRFQHVVWPKAREGADLSPLAPRGKKPKSSN